VKTNSESLPMTDAEVIPVMQLICTPLVMEDCFLLL